MCKFLHTLDIVTAKTILVPPWLTASTCPSKNQQKQTQAHKSFLHSKSPSTFQSSPYTFFPPLHQIHHRHPGVEVTSFSPLKYCPIQKKNSSKNSNNVTRITITHDTPIQKHKIKKKKKQLTFVWNLPYPQQVKEDEEESQVVQCLQPSQQTQKCLC